MSLAGKSNSLSHKEKNKKKISKDTIRQETLHSISFSASLTVEAALAFPIVLFVLCGMLFFFRVLQMEYMTHGALYTSGSSLALELEAEDDGIGKAMGYFYHELSKEDFPFHHIVAGKMGIRWKDTQLSGEYVDLRIQYDCKMPFHFLGLRNIPIMQRVRIKKWVGYQKGSGDDAEEPWVYLTENGSVYHITRECTHLCLSIHTMGTNAAVQAGYTSCSLCGSKSSDHDFYYVTEEGDRYHTKLDCSGLKRTVYMIRLSQVNGKRVCSRCGGG